MGKTDAARLAAMTKLIPAMREEHQRLGLLIDEFEAIAGGGPTIGEKLKDLETHWGELWAWRYQEPYAWTDYTKSRAQWKTLIRKIPIDPLKARVANYLHNGEPFYVDKKHPFGLFVATINQHVDSRGEAPSLNERPSGCKHSPACSDQFQHTRRRQAEVTQ